jgi:DNA-binding PadR family transcriptional regulator
MREFLRGAVRLHVLHHSAQREIYGVWMPAELAGHGYRISPGSFYPTLDKIEAERLLSSRGEVIEGRLRPLYAITSAGKWALEEAKVQLRELAEELLGGQRQ